MSELSRAVFDPATATWERRANVAEALLRTLTNAVAGFARDNGGSLPHRINLPHSVASNHVRIMDNYEMSLAEASAAKKADPDSPTGAEEAPACAEECTAVLRQMYAEACDRAGLPVPESHVTHIPPLVPFLYEDAAMRCPHGVLWHMQPTSEQIAEWARDGVE